MLCRIVISNMLTGAIRSLLGLVVVLGFHIVWILIVSLAKNWHIIVSHFRFCSLIHISDVFSLRTLIRIPLIIFSPKVSI